MRSTKGGEMFRKITALLFCAIFCFGSGMSTMPATAASEAENVFVEQTLQTYDGIYMQVKGSPADNYRKIGIVADEPLAVQPFLSVRFRNLADAAVPFCVTLEDSEGNKWKTGYNGSPQDYQEHFYIPEDTEEVQTVKEYYGCMYLTKEIGGGEILIDMTKLTCIFGAPLMNIKKIFFGLPAAYNPAEKLELIDISSAETEGLSLSDGEFSDADGNAATDAEIIASLQRTTFFDFTKVSSDEELDALFADRTLLKCNNDDAVTSTFDSYIALGKTETQKAVSLGQDCMEGIKYSLRQDRTLTSDDPELPNYCADKFGYIRIADLTDAPVAAGDALAIKMSALYNKSAFRIIVIDSDGEAYRAGAAAGEYPFVSEDGKIGQMPTYYNCLWPEKKAGTLLLEYSVFSLQSAGSCDIVNNRVADKKLGEIAEIYLSMDMAETSGEAKNRKIAIASVANVELGSETIDILADLTKYSVTSDKNESADANFAEPKNSVIAVPMEKSAFKNGNWVLGRATVAELAEKAPISPQRVGDVKILDNFAILDKGYSQEEKDSIIGDFYSLYGERSYLSAVSAGGKDALCWTMGNYVTDYQNVSGGYCGLTVNPVASAQDWGDWSGAKGMTLWVKNPQSHEISFNIAFQQVIDSQTVSYRMDYENSTVYAADTRTGEEFSFPTSTTIYLPGDFEGWLRLDFSVFGRYSATGPDEIDFSHEVIALKITSYLYDNSDMSLIFGYVGLYYEDFSVNWAFDEGGKGILDRMSEGA